MQEPTLNPETVAKEIVEHFEMMGVENITPLKTANVLAIKHILEKVFAKVKQQARDEERERFKPNPWEVVSGSDFMVLNKYYKKVLKSLTPPTTNKE